MEQAKTALALSEASMLGIHKDLCIALMVLLACQLVSSRLVTNFCKDDAKHVVAA